MWKKKMSIKLKKNIILIMSAAVNGTKFREFHFILRKGHDFFFLPVESECQ